MKPLSRACRSALAASLIALSAIPVLGGADAGAADLQTLQGRAADAAEQVTALEARMVELEADAAETAEAVASAGAKLARAESDAQAAEAELATVRDRYVQHAIAAYKMNDPTQLALILSSATLEDVYRVAQATGYAAREISQSVDDLAAASDTAERTRDDAASRRDSLMAAKARADRLAADLRGTLAQRRGRLRSLRREISQLQEEALKAAGAAARANLTPSDALLAMLGGSGPSRGIPDGYVGTGVVLEGVASWYGPGFEGNTTASGDIFDSRLYTVASKELPFGTWLHVQHEGRGVVVLVNDRGPYVGDRILDLSRAAAKAIGISGIGWVRAEIILKV